MRLMLIGLLMGCVSLFAADAVSDDADYEAYKAAQETAQKTTAKINQRDAEVKNLETNDVVGLKKRYSGKTIDEALVLWRADIRKITDPVQRFANYEWMKRVETQVVALKELHNVSTGELAIAAEKAAITVAKTK